MVDSPAISESVAENSRKTLSALLWVENRIKNIIPVPAGFEPLHQFLSAVAASSLLVCHESDLPVVRRHNFWRMILVPHAENGLGPLPRPANATCYPLSNVLSTARGIAHQFPGKGVLVLDSPHFSKNFVGETTLAYQVFYDDGDPKPGTKRAPLDVSVWYEKGKRIVNSTGGVQIQGWQFQ